VKREVQRIALGRPASRVPGPLVFHLLGKAYGVPPWVIANAPAGDVLQAWEVYNLWTEGENKRGQR
jgi:hypothetical protein